MAVERSSYTNMNASLHKKGSIYYAVISLPAGNGKFKTKWISTKCKKKNAAKEALRNILTKLENGDILEKSDVYFIDFMEEWLNNVIALTVEATTHEGYRINYKNHIHPYFEPLKLRVQDIRLKHLQQFVNDKHTSGKLDGSGGLSAQSIKKFMANISKALDYAVKSGLIQQNPSHYVDFPKPTDFTGSFYTMDELEALLQAVKGTQIETAIILAVHYGLRRGEIMGLRWKDIDFRQDTLSICNTRVRVQNEHNKKPKSKSSLRTFPLLPSVKVHLQEMKDKHREYRAIFGKDYIKSDYICVWPNGKLMDVGYLNGALSKLLKAHGLRHIRLHDLRHSTATYLNKLGFSAKEIQIWLGHANVSTTLNIYTHIDTQMKENIALKIDGLFNQKGEAQ